MLFVVLAAILLPIIREIIAAINWDYEDVSKK